MIKPKALKFGDTIGVVAPASPTLEENVEKAHKKLKDLGFKVKMGKSCYEKYGYLAGTDSLRAEDINHMFRDEEVDGIICLRGGYGTPRILELLDYDLIKKHPKVFIGYSDITALHIAITRFSRLITFHGPMVASDMLGDFNQFSKKSLFNFIMEGEYLRNIKNPPGEELKTMNPGIAEGSIIGGNLSLIADTLGTPYEIDLKGKILFIEEVGEEPYQIDRMLTQLRLAGKLKEAEGIILGDFNNCVAKSSEYDDSLTLEQVLEDIIKPMNKPTLFNLKAGHCEPVITLPFGARARLDGHKGELTLLERPVY
ncbi:S66 peptidase family protein [Clostridium sp. Cult3]|jgi:muramoyltetrapeptide carboxypeptidase|uniref:S66 peptidase family protein n=1 Tax=Clostridium sp. Cult3 TaxID=2079004 RepID=UPI001F1F0A9B|nr:LD-carboxypeptidase [Clostridium sp. Cult3]MCF6459474.1 LD-carboxypeptidase [Clostridium sp. Cult3]